MNQSQLLQLIKTLPAEWALVAVGDNKAPIGQNWGEHPLSYQDFVEAFKPQGKFSKLECESKRSKQKYHPPGDWCKAVGVLCGVPSGGLLFLDHDGASCDALIEQFSGQSVAEACPKTVGVTSGRPGRYQLIYYVPEQYWGAVATHKEKTGVIDDDGKPEQLELRWNGLQSVVIGKHPTTGAYKWLPGQSPGECSISEAPLWMIEAMLSPPPEPATPQAIRPITSTMTQWSKQDWARSYLDAIPAAEDYDTWLKVGMALHSVDDFLLADWDNWSKGASNYEPGACEKKWRSFKPENGVGVGTLGQLAKQHGWRREQPFKSQFVRPKAAANSNPDSSADSLIEPDEEVPLLARQYHLIRRRFDGKIRLNTLTKRVEIDGKPIDVDRVKLELAVHYNIQIKNKEDARDIVTMLAEENSYNPVVEYLEGCYQEYGDDISIIDGFAERYFGQTGEIYQAFLKRTLIAAVARAFEPGCKHDSVLILQGKQGVGKSSFFRTLSNGWFDDSLGAISDKDEKLKLHQTWFMEWAELEAIFRRKDIATTKSFLTSQVDAVRPPYGRTIQELKRHSIIVGSTNLDEFLSDPTGNRRFWVLPVVKPIDFKQLEQEREQIWAAAVSLYKSGESWDLSPDEKAIAATIALEYQTSDPWFEVIAFYVEAREVITTKEILSELLQIEVGRQEKPQLMRVAEILKELGWKKDIQFYRGKRQRVWVYSPELFTPPQVEVDQVDQVVDHRSKPDTEAVLSDADPPDPPQEQNFPKKDSGGSVSAYAHKTPDFFKIGGSGRSGGSDIDISRVSNDPPYWRGGSGGSGSANGHSPPLINDNANNDEWEDYDLTT